MTEAEKPLTIPIVADTSGFTGALKDLQSESRNFAAAFSGAIKSAVVGGKSFEDVLKLLALRLSNIALSSALKPLESSLSGLFGGFAASIIPSARGNVVNAEGIVPFARGGIVSAPTLFPAGNGLGVMGEAGAEAIMPLARGPDGRLGVRGQGGSQPVNITFNINTPDAQSFRKSEAQISAMVARTVARARRVS